MELNDNFLEALKKSFFNVIKNEANYLNSKVYLIGGFVRDHLLNRQFKKDIDIVVVGSGIELAKAVQKKLKGAKPVQIFKNYGTAMIKYGEINLEFVGSRKESYDLNSRNPKVMPSTLNEDQKRRDFTINALAVSLNNKNFGDILDPFNGIKDLKNKILRTPLDPNITYSDDPLRILRAIRFAAQLDFTIDENSLQAIKQNAMRIKIISKERIVDELSMILATEKPSKGFILLENTGLLNLILPELTALRGVDEINGNKHKDNFYHTLEVVDNLCLKSNNIWLRWAALFHDIGKGPTKKYLPKIGWTFHNHEFIGAKMIFEIFKRLKMPLNDKMKYVQKIVFMSSRPIIISEDHITDSAIRRLVFDAGPDIEDLITLCEADITTKNPVRFKKYHDNFKIVRQKIKSVEEKDHLRNFQPPVNGKKIMSFFGLKPSKEIGIIKHAIKEAILEGEIPNEYNAAYERMKKEGKKLGLKPYEKPI